MARDRAGGRTRRQATDRAGGSAARSRARGRHADHDAKWRRGRRRRWRGRARIRAARGPLPSVRWTGSAPIARGGSWRDRRAGHAPRDHPSSRLLERSTRARPVKIFVYEHITGGGCAGQALPHVLLPEACLMLHALAADLRVLTDTEIISLTDHRLAGMLGDWEQHVIRDRAEYETQFDALVGESKATWLIAPETGRVLERLSARVLASGKLLLSSRPRAVAVAASKRATAHALQSAQLPVLATWRPDDPQFPDHAQTFGACVAKPDD